MSEPDPRDAPPHRRHRKRPPAGGREALLDDEQRKELDRYLREFAADWDAREERFRTAFALMVAEGVMDEEERDSRLAEIREMRREHEADHRENMIEALLMTDEEWEAIVNSEEFQESMAELEAMAEGFAAAFQKLEFSADPDNPDDPVADLIARNIAGSIERMTGAIDGAAEIAEEARRQGEEE